MKAIQLTKYGRPEEGLGLVEIAEPGDPKPGQILIRVEYAPINDSDLLVASGLYAVKPKLPSISSSPNKKACGPSISSADPSFSTNSKRSVRTLFFWPDLIPSRKRMARPAAPWCVWRLMESAVMRRECYWTSSAGRQR